MKNKNKLFIEAETLTHYSTLVQCISTSLMTLQSIFSNPINTQFPLPFSSD